jgi:hypothetical protein
MAQDKAQMTPLGSSPSSNEPIDCDSQQQKKTPKKENIART